MAKKDMTSEVIVVEKGFNISKGHLAFLYLLISWPIIYILCYVTRQEWFVNYDGYLSTLSGGSGVPVNISNANLNNTVLSDKGRENILWVSFLFALLVGLLVYLFLYYF